MSSCGNLVDAIRTAARHAGFARVGIAPAGPVPHAEGFERWLARGYHASMSYMAGRRDRRLDPRKLFPGARSVICLAAAYRPAGGPEGAAAFVARYARGCDYHKELKRRCRAVADAIRRIEPAFKCRAFVDSAPVMERSLAAAAGVGFIARNGMLIVPGLGSYVLLCEIICNLPLPPNSPIASQCESCGACVDACPTGAIRPDGLVDARRCISYLTIEHRARIDRSFWPLVGRCVFGCDACQEACPHNRDAKPPPEPPAPAHSPLALAEILAWSEKDWDAATRGSAMRRASHGMFLRNASLAAGNSGDPALVEPLKALRRRRGELADEIDWAIARLAGV